MSLTEETKKIQAFIKVHPQVADLNKKEISDFYIRLIDCVVDHNHLYYVENKPLISDKEYDELFDYLKKIEEYFPQLISSNSPTQQLVGQVSEGFGKAKHKVKLASLENTYNAKDLQERDERIGRIVESRKSKVESQSGAKITYRVEPKFDGLSVELVYEKGIFVQAITRGDGQVGDDITENVKTIKNVPKKLKHALDIHVRGEIMMPKSVWKELNKEREEAGEVPFANTRNAAAGSIKLLDSKEVARRGLVCYVYDVLRAGLLHSSQGQPLEKLGLPVFDWVRTKQGLDEVVKLCEDDKVKKFLENQDIDFDGLVIKVEDEHLRELIGSTDHHPRWAVAYKFPAQVIATQVNSVDFQVGRTGIITPVANLEPVELSGVTIKRVSLHNFDFITSKDIHLHDWVWLQRSGEVIPYIVSVIKERRSKVKSQKSKVEGQEIVKIQPPRACPSCGKPVVHEDIHYYCENPHCPAQVKEKIIHFVSKQGMDIEGIGESTVDLLVQEGMIKDIADIYTLSDLKAQLQMMKFPGFAQKKVSEIAKQVEESKKKPLRRLLNGLGIPGVGKKTAVDLVKAVNSEGLSLCTTGRVYPSTGSGGHILEALTKILTNEEFLRGIYGVGEKIVEGIISFMKHHKVLLKRLESYGVNLNPAKYAEGMVDAEHAKGSFSITGTFPISREKIVEEMQKNGYLFHDNPTKTTDFMLVGEDAGSKKAKAEAMGLRVYEGWDVVVKEFSFLKNVVSEISNKPQIQSLF